jgi:hypothetical protein
MLPEMMKKLPGYDPDVKKSRAEAQNMMRTLGYGPDNRLNLKSSPVTCRIFGTLRPLQPIS